MATTSAPAASADAIVDPVVSAICVSPAASAATDGGPPPSGRMSMSSPYLANMPFSWPYQIGRWAPPSGCDTAMRVSPLGTGLAAAEAPLAAGLAAAEPLAAGFAAAEAAPLAAGLADAEAAGFAVALAAV